MPNELMTRRARTLARTFADAIKNSSSLRRGNVSYLKVEKVVIPSIKPMGAPWAVSPGERCCACRIP
jgi:hypothetical protein